MSQNNLNIDPENYKIYYEERKSLIENSVKSAELLARTILTLSAGSFGLSIAFIKDIAPYNRPHTNWLLIVAWLSYCMTILATLVSTYFSQKAHFKQVEILEEVYFQKRETPSINPYNRIIEILTVIVIVAFVFGTFFLAFYAIFNL